MQMLAQKLNMEQIAAEKWIVKMVSDAQLNAKIDAQSGHVILGLEPPDVYQQVPEMPVTAAHTLTPLQPATRSHGHRATRPCAHTLIR